MRLERLVVVWAALFATVAACSSVRHGERSLGDASPDTSPTAFIDDPAGPPGACRALVRAVMARDPARLKSILAGGCDPHGTAGARALELAIAGGQVEATRALLEAGVDPNAAGSQGRSIAMWLGSGQRFTDDDLLEVARLLDGHGCRFDGARPPRAPDLVTNLAPRKLPKTLAFLASKSAPGDATHALKAIARRDDLASIEALLGAGADPLDGIALSSALMDAAGAGLTSSVTAMLRQVTDKQSPKVLAAYRRASEAGHADTARAFVDAGVQAPPTTSPTRPACEPRELTAEEVALLTRVALPSTRGLSGLAGAMRCKLRQQCGTMILVDCNSAADGPAYYIDEANAKLLATCGGACMGGRCTSCPPPGWTCPCKL